MKFSLIICTYKRAKAIQDLMDSVSQQTLYPDQVLIVDGSPDSETELVFNNVNYKNIQYCKVTPEQRGLTKQRNFGVAKVAEEAEVVCFLDDDTVLEPSYFEEVIRVFKNHSGVVGVGGVAVNENRWQVKKEGKQYDGKKYYEWEGYVCKEGQRNVIRNYLGLASNKPPGVMPEYSHGRTMGYPLTGKTYEVDLLIGMSMAFRKKVVDAIPFSTYFEGYGLYEDADFSIRAQQFGKLVLATAAQLNHYHDASGRPNQYKYGKMVTRNGWRIWRLKYPNPSMKAKVKWHLISWVLIGLRGLNVLTTSKRKEAFTEVIGRVFGLLYIFKNNMSHND